MTITHRTRILAVLFTCVLGAALLAAPKLDDLRGVDELKTSFNHDTGKVRLVLLVSPT